MGICFGGSGNENDKVLCFGQIGQQKNLEIEEKCRNDNMKEQKIIKLLLLGAGESGKSTLFKQMIYLHGDNRFKDLKSKKSKWIRNVHSNTLWAIKTLVEQANIFAEQKPEYETKIDKEHAAAASFILDESEKMEVDGLVLTPEQAQMIKDLWESDAIQNTYNHAHEFQLIDSCAHFLTKICEIASPDYVPCFEDILRIRIRTTGISETQVEMQGTKYLMIDVGGQRSERKKWLGCFDQVTAVLFVVALSAYNQTLYEDNNVNRMHESLDIWKQIVNTKEFKDTSFIVFLNKRDLFAQKLEKKHPLTVCFPKFKEQSPDLDPLNYNDCIEFIKQRYLERAEDEERKKKIVFHVTCATDTDNIMKVYGSVRDIIIDHHFSQMNLNE